MYFGRVKCKFQGGAHRIQEGANAPPAPSMKPCIYMCVSYTVLYTFHPRAANQPATFSLHIPPQSSQSTSHILSTHSTPEQPINQPHSLLQTPLEVPIPSQRHPIPIIPRVPLSASPEHCQSKNCTLSKNILSFHSW